MVPGAGEAGMKMKTETGGGCSPQERGSACELSRKTKAHVQRGRWFALAGEPGM